jgi:hypothetical protein
MAAAPKLRNAPVVGARDASEFVRFVRFVRARDAWRPPSDASGFVRFVRFVRARDARRHVPFAAFVRAPYAGAGARVLASRGDAEGDAHVC